MCSIGQDMSDQSVVSACQWRHTILRESLGALHQTMNGVYGDWDLTRAA